MTFTRWSPRFALAALVLNAVPALAMAPAHAAPASAAPTSAPKPWVSVKGPDAFSPNGDGRHDTARFKVKVKKRSSVTLKVVRAGKVVRGPIKLGKRKAGSTIAWTWNGKNSKGKRVPDAWAHLPEGYVVKVVAKSLRTGKKSVARHRLTVDTKADMTSAARLVVNSDTIYPRTTVMRDLIWFSTEGGAGAARGDEYLTEDVTGTLVIRTPKGRKLAEVISDRWNEHWNTGSAQVAWDGQQDDLQVDNGRYYGDVKARLRVEDEVGNVAQTPPITIHVSHKRLEPKRITTTVAPQQTQYVPTTGDYCGKYECGPPCGVLVPSERAEMPLGLSYRSRVCGWDQSVGRHSIALPDDAVRGGLVESVTMRGRPTVDGEFDTARLTVWGGPAVTSEASREETTTRASRRHDYESINWFDTLTWKVETFDDDWYDVAEFDVTYAYLVVGGD